MDKIKFDGRRIALIDIARPYADGRTAGPRDLYWWMRAARK